MIRVPKKLFRSSSFGLYLLIVKSFGLGTEFLSCPKEKSKYSRQVFEPRGASLKLVEGINEATTRCDDAVDRDCDLCPAVWRPTRVRRTRRYLGLALASSGVDELRRLLGLVTASTVGETATRRVTTDVGAVGRRPLGIEELDDRIPPEPGSADIPGAYFAQSE